MEFLSACAWSPQSTATCSDVEFHRIGAAWHWTLFEQPEALSQRRAEKLSNINMDEF
jgi:hypothetical protein